MKITLLSHFDNIQGPIILLAKGDGELSTAEKDIQRIPELMNLYRKGFFYVEFGQFKSANLMFEMPSPAARGGVEILLASICETEDELNTTLAKQYLESFVAELLASKGLYEAFHVNGKQRGENSPAKKAELEELFHGFFESVPSGTSIKAKASANIFVFGLEKAGKSTIILALKSLVHRDLPPTMSVDVSKVNIDDMTVMIYDAPGQSRFRNLWTSHLAQQHGLVFVLDTSDPRRLDENKHVLHEIVARPDTKNLPVLMLLNKVDICKPKVKDVLKQLEWKEVSKKRPAKEFLTCGVTGEGVCDAFGWLAKSLAA